MRDAGCGMRDAGCGARIPHPASRIPHPALKLELASTSVTVYIFEYKLQISHCCTSAAACTRCMFGADTATASRLNYVIV